MQIAYELKSFPIGGNTRGYKYELLYQGVGGGILRITYPEFLNDLVRPAFSQDLTYDLDASGPTEISFRAAQFRVHEANNNEIRYEVLAGL